MNQLSNSSSPYLLQHKDNPVHWHEWSGSSLLKAKKENKPILVSVGYSTCHWCHVMAHESFEDHDIAAIMNEFFINVKIDREERPDLDLYLMGAVQAMGISGGWPLHCFLTPDLKPFYGGTYFPPVKKYGRMSWPDVLMAVHQAWLKKNPELIQQADKLSRFLNEKQLDIHNIEETRSFDDFLETLNPYMDHEEGGFGFGQKFPNTMALNFLWNHGNSDHQTFVVKSLHQMCFKGMFDVVQAGFFRYTVDRQWAIPHFEKMAYDHALILSSLAMVSGKVNQYGLNHFLKSSLIFWEENMQSNESLFYSAMDADSEGEEGKYYSWSADEIEKLESEYPSVKNDLSWEPIPHTEPTEFHVQLNLDQWESISNETLSALNFLRGVRKLRIPPSTDTKCILAWNALLCSTYVSAWHMNQSEEYLQKAKTLLDDLLRHFIREDTKYYRYRKDGQAYGLAFLEDYAYLAQAMMDLHQITLDDSLLLHCHQIIKIIETEFSHPSGFYTMTSLNHFDAIQHSIDLSDHSLPNPNCIIYAIKYKLAILQEDEEQMEKIKSIVQQVCSGPKEIIFSRISWADLFLKISSPYWKINCYDAISAYLYLDKMKVQNIVLSKDLNLTQGQIQICAHQVCYPVIKDHVDLEVFQKNL